MNVPAPDMGTNEQTMMWIADEYRRLKPDDINGMACVTGKPLGGNGIEGRTEATGRGVQFALQAFFETECDVQKAGFTSRDLRGRTVIVQGLGNVGYHAAKFLSTEDGCKIIAVIERDGVIRNAEGIDIDALKTHVITNGGVQGFAGGDFDPDGAKALKDVCDILVPAAMERVIHSGNADNIQAQLVIEAANGPTTYEADQILRKRGIQHMQNYPAHGMTPAIPHMICAALPIGLQSTTSPKRIVQSGFKKIARIASVFLQFWDSFIKRQSKLNPVFRRTFDRFALPQQW